MFLFEVKTSDPGSFARKTEWSYKDLLEIPIFSLDVLLENVVATLGDQKSRILGPTIIFS